MGHFHALADAVAVAADRLVAVVRVGSDGGVVVRDLANGGLSTISASELRAPPSRKAILARVRALDKRQVAKARLQQSEAASLVDSVPGTYRVDRALEVVQIDHSPVDVIVVDEAHRLPIGRPWLTLAIDVATRVVVGFQVSLEAPSSTSVALCLTQAVRPKEPWLKARALACLWPGGDCHAPCTPTMARISPALPCVEVATNTASS